MGKLTIEPDVVKGKPVWNVLDWQWNGKTFLATSLRRVGAYVIIYYSSEKNLLLWACWTKRHLGFHVMDTGKRYAIVPTRRFFRRLIKRWQLRRAGVL